LSERYEAATSQFHEYPSANAGHPITAVTDNAHLTDVTADTVDLA
jgi:hypothetical protein